MSDTSLDNLDIIAAVSDLNQKIFDLTDREDIRLTATFDGTSAYIEFLGKCIWNEDEDERIYDEVEDSYQSLPDYLMDRITCEIANLHELSGVLAGYPSRSPAPEGVSDANAEFKRFSGELPIEHPPFPKYVRLGDSEGSALIHEGKGVYHRPAGQWSVTAESDYGSLAVSKTQGRPMKHAAGLPLIECTEQEYLDSNAGYV